MVGFDYRQRVVRTVLLGTYTCANDPILVYSLMVFWTQKCRAQQTFVPVFSPIEDGPTQDDDELIADGWQMADGQMDF